MAVCEICLRSPCLNGCPNEVIPIIGVCHRCRNDIEYGAQYLDFHGEYICEECLNEMPMSALLSMFGYELQTAGKED